MRLVAWNTNYNNHPRRSFEACVDLLEDFDADILVLSEVAHPATTHPGSVEWIGNCSPGLVVVARNGLSVSPSLLNNNAPANFAAFTVRGRITFLLLAAWPVTAPYHQVLMQGLNLFASATPASPRILAGDLNTSSSVKGQEQTHPLFVDRAAALGLSSVYHHMSGEDHGKESHPTYFRHHKSSNPFHIDYCFVSADLLPSASLGIHRGPVRCSQSDHVPLVLDIPDSRFGTQGH